MNVSAGSFTSLAQIPEFEVPGSTNLGDRINLLLAGGDGDLKIFSDQKPNGLSRHLLRLEFEMMRGTSFVLVLASHERREHEGKEVSVGIRRLGYPLLKGFDQSVGGPCVCAKRPTRSLEGSI